MVREAVTDTSFLVSLLNDQDKHYPACKLLYDNAEMIHMPQSVLTETAYMLTARYGNKTVVSFIENLADSAFNVVALTPADLTHTAAILKKYADSRIDFVDASVMAMAERLALPTILTLDLRDFSIVRREDGSPFDLLPAPA